MNKIDICTRETIAKGFGQLGVVCPMSQPPYTYPLAFADMLVKNGVDYLFMPFMAPEVRMPWMMGGTEQSADVEGFRSGMTAEMCFELIGKVREQYPTVPIVVVSFYNDVLCYGVERFAEKCRQHQVDGVDTPGYCLVTNGDYSGYGAALADANVHLIHPISPDLAMAPVGTREYNLLVRLLEVGSGFVFLMADSGGKSGATGALPVAQLKPAAARIRTVQKELGKTCGIITVCGIASPQNCREAIACGTDGVLMASAVIRKIQAGEPLKQIGRYISSMKQGLKR